MSGHSQNTGVLKPQHRLTFGYWGGGSFGQVALYRLEDTSPLSRTRVKRQTWAEGSLRDPGSKNRMGVITEDTAGFHMHAHTCMCTLVHAHTHIHFLLLVCIS